MPNSQFHKKTDKEVIQLAEHLFTPSKSLAKKFNGEKYPQTTIIFGRTYLPVEEFSALVDKLRLDEYEYIVHDKDVNEDGTPKQTHIHFLLYKAKTFRLTPFLKVTQNTHIELPRSKVDAEKYLTHANSPKKYQYSRTELIEFHKDGINTLAMTRAEERENSNAQMLDDLANLDMRALAEKYGRDYMLNWQRYAVFRKQVEYEDARKDIDDYTSTCDIYETKITHVDDDGVPVTLQLADYVALSFSQAIHDGWCGHLPSSWDMLVLYRKVLDDWREKVDCPWEERARAQHKADLESNYVFKEDSNV